MREIREIIIHCSATPEGRDCTVADIDRWHRERGYKCIGYHFVIYRDGSIHVGRAKETIGAHCRGHNAHSIGICYIGGLPSPPKHFCSSAKCRDSGGLDTRTPAQKDSMRALIEQLKEEFPNATIHGHNDFNPHKACPCFNAAMEYADL